MGRSSGENGSGTGEIPVQESPGMEGAHWGLENCDNMDSETQPLEEVRTRSKGEMEERVKDTLPKETEEDEEADKEQPFNPLIVPGKWI